jgi:hypothetical protein
MRASNLDNLWAYSAPSQPPDRLSFIATMIDGKRSRVWSNGRSAKAGPVCAASFAQLRGGRALVR